MIKRSAILLILSAILILAGCGKSRTKVNQISPLTSPSGAYVLKMPIERVGRCHYWSLEIRDTVGNLLYKDKDTEEGGFPARFNVYWCREQPQKILPQASSSSGDPNEKNWPSKYCDSSKKNESDLPVTPVSLRGTPLGSLKSKEVTQPPFPYQEYVKQAA